MNLFSNLRENYGQSTVRIVRELEKNERKIANFRNHLVFSLRCKDEDVIPSSLWIKCPIPTQNARNIIHRTQKQLLNERIRYINNKIGYLKHEKERRETTVFTSLPRATADIVVSFTARAGERQFQETKWRHINKLERQCNKKKAAEEVDLTGSQMKKWVVNLSKYKLSKDETSVLAKGLNFAVSPKHIPTDDFIVATEQACNKLSPTESDVLRAEVTQKLKSHKPTSSNITKGERQALNTLKKQKEIMIIGADKGKATVVMDIEEYESKVSSMLADEKTYEPLKSNPTGNYKRKLISSLQRLKRESKITSQQYDYLYPTSESVPRLYCTPKIHKKDNPLRPIVDYTGSIGYNVSRALADLLAPLVGKTVHHCENSKQLAETLSKVKIEEDEIMISHDVVSLFTNTPIDVALSIIRERLTCDPTLRKRTKLEVDDIMELLSFVLTTTYFQFRGKIYRQKFGVAMGSPVSPIVSNLFMEHLEQRVIATAPDECKPQIWKWYVDDIFEIIKKGETTNLTDHINTIDTSNSIKFTYEEETNGQLPFLMLLSSENQMVV